jgi:hypothetical protein
VVGVMRSSTPKILRIARFRADGDAEMILGARRDHRVRASTPD